MSFKQRMFEYLKLDNAPELRILDLSWNMIHGDDIRSICNSLKVKEFNILCIYFIRCMYQSKNNQSLERLVLMMNRLGNEGAMLIANMLSNNETLIELDLSNNHIEKDGVDIFASKLEMNHSLLKVWVRIFCFFYRRLNFLYNQKFGNNNIGTFGSLLLLKAIDHVKSQIEYLNIEVKFY